MYPLNFKYVIAGVYQYTSKFEQPIVASLWESEDDNSTSIEKFIVNQTIGRDFTKVPVYEMLHNIYNVVPLVDERYPVREHRQKLMDLIYAKTGTVVNNKHTCVILKNLHKLHAFAVKRQACKIYLLSLVEEGKKMKDKKMVWNVCNLDVKWEEFYDEEYYKKTGEIVHY